MFHREIESGKNLVNNVNAWVWQIGKQNKLYQKSTNLSYRITYVMTHETPKPLLMSLKTNINKMLSVDFLPLNLEEPADFVKLLLVATSEHSRVAIS